MKYPPFIKDKNGKYDRIPYELMITTVLGKGFTQETLKDNELARSFVAKYSKHFWQIGSGYGHGDETVYFFGKRSRFARLNDAAHVVLVVGAFITAVTVIVYVVSTIYEAVFR